MEVGSAGCGHIGDSLVVTEEGSDYLTGYPRRLLMVQPAPKAGYLTLWTDFSTH